MFDKKPNFSKHYANLPHIMFDPRRQNITKLNSLELVIAVWCLYLMFQAQPTFGKRSLRQLMVNSLQKGLQTGYKH